MKRIFTNRIYKQEDLKELYKETCNKYKNYDKNELSNMWNDIIKELND